ncbi:EamA family transporter [Schaalia canis]|uniref:EamA family transporter n=1 Tax=Schaalia canis TaxID=100469 RepID=A0A3P1SEP3_9ACTO|nr:EamA family transporter [Schaalia canis]RRC94782.1 EamA family transporter [Schaalia canis]
MQPSEADPAPQTRLIDRVPPQFFIVGSALIQYIGAAIAVGLFTIMSPSEVAWWRILIAAAVLLVWRRPWRVGLTRADLIRSGIFGLAMTAMNMTFYQAIEYLPLGTAVSLEFIGPVSVAVLRGRGWAPRIAALFAFGGVVAIGGVGIDLSDPKVLIGVAWIMSAALMWALYIVLGQHIASQRSGITNLAVGSTIGALVTAPFFVSSVAVVAGDWTVFVALLGVGVLSTVLPYSLEALAMSRVSASTFALFTALLPATSALVGALMLRQIPGLGEVLGLVLISVAVAITSRTPRR